MQTISKSASKLVAALICGALFAGSAMAQKAKTGALVRALAPYLGAQLVVLALVVLVPSLAHLAEPPRPAGPPAETIDDDAARKKFNDMLNLPPPPQE